MTVKQVNAPKNVIGAQYYSPKLYVTVTTTTFNIMHQNIASILAKQDILEITLQELNKSGNEPDLICLSETFLITGNEKYINIHK